MKVYTGTSGFYYSDWKEVFYPETIKRAEWLQYYARHFDTVEINNTFYATPRKSSFEKWDRDTPDDFRFTLKGSRFVTHLRKLQGVQEGMTNFYTAIEPLAHKTECILWQLPPSMYFHEPTLRNFANSCSSHYTNVLEFRHPSWFTEYCYNLLRELNISYCILSNPDNLPEVAITTTPTAYLRFHGKDPQQRYRYLYTEVELKEWADKMQSLLPERLFIYFNNDYEGHAITNARQIRSMLKESS